MNTKNILDDAVKTIRAIPAKLSGDDSPLADSWEEIKEQVQHEKSLFWQAYLDTMKGIIESTVYSLSDEDRAAVAEKLNVMPENSKQLFQALMKRLIARAKKEKIRYEPFDFSYFRYSIGDMAVYAQVVERNGIFTCKILAYSGAAPFGERGEVNTDIIEDTMSSEEFKQARRQNWPDKWERSSIALNMEENLCIYNEVAKDASISVEEATELAGRP